MSPRTQTILVLVGVLVTTTTLLVFCAPLCFTEGCTPQQRAAAAADLTLVQSGMGPAEACIERDILLGEIADPLAIVADCGAVTVQDIEQTASNLLNEPAGVDAGAPRTASHARVRALRASCRALLADASRSPAEVGNGDVQGDRVTQ